MFYRMYSLFSVEFRVSFIKCFKWCLRLNSKMLTKNTIMQSAFIWYLVYPKQSKKYRDKKRTALSSIIRDLHNHNMAL